MHNSRYIEKIANTYKAAHFKAKISLSLNKAVDTDSCIELLQETDDLSNEEIKQTYTDCKEVIKLLTAIIKR